MQPDTLDAGSALFRAVSEGDTVVLTHSAPAWLIACEDNPRLIQRSGDSWTLLRDDRPETFGLQLAAHYLDGTYHSDCNLSLGCDVGFCQPFPESQQALQGYRARLLAREYVQVGQRGGRRCDGDDAGSQLRYYLDSQCQTGALTEDVAVE